LDSVENSDSTILLNKHNIQSDFEQTLSIFLIYMYASVSLTKCVDSDVFQCSCVLTSLP